MTAAAMDVATRQDGSSDTAGAVKTPSGGGAGATRSAIPAERSAADAAKAKHRGKYDKKKSRGRDDDHDDDAKAPSSGASPRKHASLSPVERMEKRIRAAKRATRSELSVSGGEWRKHGFADDPEVLSVSNLGDDVPRISAKEVTFEQFRERFEKPRLPCIITDAMDGWRATASWTYDHFLERFRDHKFKVGSDDDGYAVRLKFSHIHHYVNDPEHMRDDSPLYIFDGSFGDKEGSKPLLRDYAVPEYFREDLFGIVGEKRRPPYRWVVIGPPRSGSSVHVDPLATSAWNALISGRKRWCLFPPSPTLKKPHLKPKGIGLDGESVTWFKKMYPRTRSSDWPHHRPLDAVQNPGEIMYVPDGWWHAVLNLEHTVAVTQNVVGSARFAKVWRMTKRGRPKMSAQWLAKLRERRPDLAAVADAQPRRGEESAGEETSSSSSSSSSEESSDTEDEYAFEGFGTLPARKKGDREAGDARNRTQTSDETLREMASEREGRKSASENGGGKRAKSPKSPKSPKKKSKKGDDVEMAG
jgi:histone arginine demethylase JMJD6